MPTTIDKLEVAIKQSFEEYLHEKLNKVFLTHQMYMKEIMTFYGGNNYKISHMGKHRL